MSFKDRLVKFICPSITRMFIIRLLVVCLVSYLFFGHVMRPMRIAGHSMHPTYQDGQVNLCFLWRYRWSPPEVGDVVMVRFTGNSTMYLKRVVAVAGQTVAFKQGQLFVDGQAVTEPYVTGPCDWEWPVRKVRAGNIYVIGDNRSVPVETHDFGQTSLNNISGSPLW